MTTPPFLMALALMFWGLQTGFFVFGVVMAVILEVSHWIKARWQFSDEEYNRVFDLCGLLLIGAGAIATTSDDIRVPALLIALWFPFIFFPIMAAQAFGSRAKLTMRTLNWFFLRRRKTGLANKELNISYLYFGLCILSASAAPPSSAEGTGSPFGPNTFYFVIVFLLGWAFIALRPRRVHLAVWCVLVACAVTIGFATHQGLQQAQQGLEALVSNWVGRLGRYDVNMMESQTAIGRIGRLKMSDEILFRVEPEKGPVPELLRQMSYDIPRYEPAGRVLWQASRIDSSMVPIDSEDSWKLLPQSGEGTVRISTTLFRRGGVLSLPAGTVELRELPVGSLVTNKMGMARVENGLKFIRFLADYNPSATFDVQPDYEGADLHAVPERDEEVLIALADQLGLFSPISVEEKLRIIHNFFQDNFTYSTYVRGEHLDPTGEMSPLSVFLTKTRSGHCEYFASAAVLLARTAMIPARYATGFSVQEGSKDGKMFVVRGKHAHAWAIVYRDGAWHDFDTTPASWEQVEISGTSVWRSISDLWSRLKFEFAKWRYSESNIQRYAIWLLIPLIAFLMWRIVFRKRGKHSSAAADSDLEWPGLDSEIYAVEEELAKRQLYRHPDEPVARWKVRVLESAAVPPAFATAVDLHVRHRFDPKGLNAEERKKLRESARECLRILKAAQRNQEASAAANSQAG